MEYSGLQDMRGAAREISGRVARGTSDALARVHEAVSPNQNVNVGDLERLASTVGGTILIFSGLSRGSLTGCLLALGGGALIQRGISGHCAVYDRLGQSTARQASPAKIDGTHVRRPLASEGMLASASRGA